MKELEAFDPNLAKRRQILVANKIDLLGDAQERLNKVESLASAEKLPFYAISAMKKQGLRPVVAEMKSVLEELEDKEKNTSDA